MSQITTLTLQISALLSFIIHGELLSSFVNGIGSTRYMYSDSPVGFLLLNDILDVGGNVFDTCYAGS
jgi:hypothetical protein